MASTPRVLGQQTEITFLLNGQQVSNSMAIKSNTLEFQMEILTEGYLGETTNRRDSVFNGVSGSCDVHFSDNKLFELVSALIDAARRRVAGVVMNVKHTFKFSTQQRAIVVLPGVSVGAIPINNGGRTEFVGATIPYECEQGSFLLA